MEFHCRHCRRFEKKYKVQERDDSNAFFGRKRNAEGTLLERNLFDAIVISAASQHRAQAYALHLNNRRQQWEGKRCKNPYCPLLGTQILLLKAPHPHQNYTDSETEIGNGGAILNAVKVAYDALSCNEKRRTTTNKKSNFDNDDRNYGSISSKISNEKRILVLLCDEYEDVNDHRRFPLFSLNGKALCEYPLHCFDSHNGTLESKNRSSFGTAENRKYSIDINDMKNNYNNKHSFKEEHKFDTVKHIDILLKSLAFICSDVKNGGIFVASFENLLKLFPYSLDILIDEEEEEEGEGEDEEKNDENNDNAMDKKLITYSKEMSFKWWEKGVTALGIPINSMIANSENRKTLFSNDLYTEENMDHMVCNLLKIDKNNQNVTEVCCDFNHNMNEKKCIEDAECIKGKETEHSFSKKEGETMDSFSLLMLNDSGIVYFAPDAAHILLSLANDDPIFRAFTYEGEDHDQVPSSPFYLRNNLFKCLVNLNATTTNIYNENSKINDNISEFEERNQHFSKIIDGIIKEKFRNISFKASYTNSVENQCISLLDIKHSDYLNLFKCWVPKEKSSSNCSDNNKNNNNNNNDNNNNNNNDTITKSKIKSSLEWNTSIELYSKNSFNVNMFFINSLYIPSKNSSCSRPEGKFSSLVMNSYFSARDILIEENCICTGVFLSKNNNNDHPPFLETNKNTIIQEMCISLDFLSTHCNLGILKNIKTTSSPSSSFYLPNENPKIIQNNIFSNDINFDEYLGNVFATYGMFDNLTEPMQSDKATFLNIPIDTFLNKTKILPSDLWPSSVNCKNKEYCNSQKRTMCMWNALLFPLEIINKTTKQKSFLNLMNLSSKNNILNENMEKEISQGFLLENIGLEFLLWIQSLVNPNSTHEKLFDASSVTSLRNKWQQTIRLSFEDIYKHADLVEIIEQNREIQFSLDLQFIKNVLQKRQMNSLMPLLKKWVFLSQCTDTPMFCDKSIINRLLFELDEIAAKGPIDVTARTLSAIGDVLELVAHSNSSDQLFSRFGPHNNKEWQYGYRLLRSKLCGIFSLEKKLHSSLNNNILQVSRQLKDRLINTHRKAIYYLTGLRNIWIRRSGMDPLECMRISRHYDGASQILIGRCVESDITAYEYVSEQNHINKNNNNNKKKGESEKYDAIDSLELNQWATVKAPVRVDLAGGWSDTPPISYEHGGTVVNVSVLIDEKYPLGCRARWTEFPVKYGNDDQFNVIASGSAYSNHTDAIKQSVVIIGTDEVEPLHSDNDFSSENKENSNDISDCENKSMTKNANDRKKMNDVICHSINDLMDYGNPSAPGALIKSVLISMGIILLPDDDNDAFFERPNTQTHGYEKNTNIKFNLPDKQLHRIHSLEIRSWSHLPTGTGLGVSSILAAASILAIGRVIGRHYSANSLIKLVLRVEQMLSTGGGWQDQVGAILPLFKYIVSPRRFPIEVYPQNINIKSCRTGNHSDNNNNNNNNSINKIINSNSFHENGREKDGNGELKFEDIFNKHALLLYTGESRLARNLLQSVIRKWFHRGKHITQLVDALCNNAEEAKKCIVEGDIEGLGKCIDTYWYQKKTLAGNSSAEPPLVKDLMNILRSSGKLLGMSLCGAGGGGFMIIITRKPHQFEEIQKILKQNKMLYPEGKVKLHRTSVCLEPLHVDVEITKE